MSGGVQSGAHKRTVAVRDCGADRSLVSEPAFVVALPVPRRPGGGVGVANIAVLLIEDNADLCANMWDFLEPRGYTVDAANDGISGLNLASTREYDVIVLDLTLPQIDGLEVCRRLRSDSGRSTPVLILTARDTLEDKLRGFESGADDYLVKPFALEELDARLLALVKRSSPEQASRLLQVGDLTFDLETLEVTRAGKRIKLTPTSLQILELLMRRSRCIVPRRELERALWGDAPPDSDSLRAHIHTLRSAIDKSFDVPLLHTVHGIGYRLGNPDGEEK